MQIHRGWATLSLALAACPSPLSFTADPVAVDAGHDAGQPTVPLLAHCGADDGLGCSLDGGSGICCGGACSDDQTDPANCDGCGQGCSTGAACVEGSCVAVAGGLATCTAGGCVAPLVCAGGYFCVPAACGGGTPGGACLLPGAAQGICCDGGCTTTREGCLGPIVPVPVPDAGRGDGGVAGCGANGASCTIADGGGAGACCRNACVATQSDPANCDGCGQACPSGAACVEGSCLADGGIAGCADGGCASGLDCAGSYYCTSKCQGGESGPACALDGGFYGVCCDGSCRDPAQGCSGVLDAG